MTSSAEGPVRRPGPGWLVVARHELAGHLRSVRLGVVVAVLALAGLAAVYTAASGIRQAATQASGSPSLFLRLFTLAPENIPFAFLQFVSLLGPLLGIAFGFDAINVERSQRTLPRLLAQPLHRDDVINGKFVAGLATIAVVLTALLGVVAGLGILRLGIVPAPADVLRLGGWLLVSVLYIGFWLAFALTCSVYLRRAATAAMVAFGVWLLVALFGGLLVGILADVIAPLPDQPTPAETLAHTNLEETLARLSPATLYEEATRALLTPQLGSFGVVLRRQLVRAVPSQLPVTQSLLLVWPQLTALVALTVVTFALAYVRFLTEEIRA